MRRRHGDGGKGPFSVGLTLTTDEQHALVQAAQEGDASARQRLFEGFMGFVIQISRSYRRRGVSHESLIEGGGLGLMQAIDRFDPAQGYRFSTYATYWIRQGMNQKVDDYRRTRRFAWPW